MDNELQGRTNKLKLREQPAKQPTIEKPKPERTIDICEISYPAFHTNLKRSENTLFSLSLYELDRELEDRKRGQEQESKAEELNLISQQPHKTELQ
jgi:hypothetical protein